MAKILSKFQPAQSLLSRSLEPGSVMLDVQSAQAFPSCDCSDCGWPRRTSETVVSKSRRQVSLSLHTDASPWCARCGWLASLRTCSSRICLRHSAGNLKQSEKNTDSETEMNKDGVSDKRV